MKTNIKRTPKKETLTVRTKGRPDTIVPLPVGTIAEWSESARRAGVRRQTWINQFVGELLRDAINRGLIFDRVTGQMVATRY